MPFWQGEFAHSIGMAMEDCPYDPNSINGVRWLDGWWLSWALSL